MFTFTFTLLLGCRRSPFSFHCPSHHAHALQSASIGSVDVFQKLQIIALTLSDNTPIMLSPRSLLPIKAHIATRNKNTEHLVEVLGIFDSLHMHTQ